ncbi:MAG: hypothetical protein R6T91_08415 [Bacteroidales bacterium]
MKVKLLLLFCIGVFFLTPKLYAQENPINFSLAKSHWKSAFKNGEDFFMGASLYNFRIQGNQNSARFKDYIPNGYSLYGGYSYVTDHEGYDRLYSAFEFILGKREASFSHADIGADELDLFTAKKFSDYFISVPLRFGYSIPVGRNSFIGLESGAYMLWSFANEISNSNGSREVSCAVGSDEQEMRMLDIGWANKITWSYRAFFAHIGFDFGWRNFAPYESDYLLKNQVNYSIAVGYRFGSKIHKEDMNKLNNLSGGLLDDGDEQTEEEDGDDKRQSDLNKDDDDQENENKKDPPRKTNKKFPKQ